MAQALSVSIIGDSRGYERALLRASAGTNKFGSSLAQLGKTAALVGGAAGFGAVFVTLKHGFAELKESQQVAAQTGAVLKSTGQAANVSAKHVGDLATSLSKLSGADDEAIQAGENMLLTFTNIRNQTGKNNDIFNQATKTLTDFAFAMNRGAAPSAEQLSKNAILLGKALNDPIKGVTALRRVGVAFTADQIKTIKALVDSGHAMDAQKLILRELNKEFGGSAKAAGETFPGQLNKLKNAFDEVAGQIAAKLLPALTAAVAWINDHWPQITAVMMAVANAVGTAISATAEVIRRNWGTISATFRTVIDDIVSFGRGLVAFLKTDLGHAAIVGAAALTTFVLALKAVNAVLAVTAATGGAGPAAAFFAIATAVGYLGIKTGLLHVPFLTAQTDTQKLTGALREVEGQAGRTADAFDKLADVDLSLKDAHLRVVESSHAVLAAKKAVTDASDGTKKKTLEEKLADDNLARAQLSHAQAVRDYTKAQQEHSDAIDKTAAEINKTIPAYVNILGQVAKVGQVHGEAAKGVGAFKDETAAAGRANAVAAEFIRTAGADLIKTGQAAFQASFHMKDSSDAAVLSKRLFGELQVAAGSLAVQLGKVPSKKQIIAEAVLKNGPIFIDSLKAWVAEAQKAGVQVPAYIQQAINQWDDKAPGARAAGFNVGQSFATGLGAGIAANVINAVNAATNLVNQAIAAGRAAAQAKSPSKLMIRLGQDMVEGMRIGLGNVKVLGAELTAALLKAFSSSTFASAKTAAVKGLSVVGNAIVAAAKKYGVDARAALAVAKTEGGLHYGEVGDQGTSFGPFQLHIGGANPYGDPKQAEAFANSIRGIEYALRKMAEAGAAGKTGLAAITAIVKNFEVPANIAGEIQKAWGYYQQLGPKVAAGVAAAGPMIGAAHMKVIQGLVALVKQYAPQIGKEQVQAIIAGVDLASPQAVAKAREAVQQWIAAARQAVVEGKAGLKTAFATLANEVLAAFDAVVDKWVPPSQRILDKMQIEDQINAAVKAVADAQTAVDQAFAQLQADLAAGPKEGETQVDYEARVAADKAALQKATEDLGAAQRSYTETQLQLQAAQEQKAHDEKAARDREALAGDLLRVQEWLAKHPGEYAKAQEKIMAILKKYHIPLYEAGKALSSQFAAGMKEGIGEVIAAAKALAAALEKIPGVNAGGGGGGGATTQGNSPAHTGGGGLGGTGVPTSTGGRGSVTNVTVNMPNYLGDVRTAAQEIRTELQRVGRDNAINPLAI